MLVIGLMSGTSADGIDAALVELHGIPPYLTWKLHSHVTLPHTPALRSEILACCQPQTGTVDRICGLHAALGHAFADAVQQLVVAAGLTLEQIDLIGSHGQTLWHAPDGTPAATLQLGCPAILAERTGITVVSDFRTRDIAAGGQGAPLVAAVDQLLLAHPTQVRVAQNIGGIANLTLLAPGQNLAFDTGPGNLLIDCITTWATAGQQQYDQYGALAATGQIHPGLLEELLSHPYYQLPPPKTTGRELFGAATAQQIIERGQHLGLTAPDLLATVTALTAQTIAGAYRAWLPTLPELVIVSGGGAHNATLMRQLGLALPGIPITTSDAYGIPGDAKEAMAFAVLAYETWHGRPGNLPAATGAARSVVLGSITPGTHRPGLWKQTTTASVTETRNQDSMEIDQLPTLAMLQLFNQADQLVPAAVATQLPMIASAIDAIAPRMQQGGRLVYVGAGTSGRLGTLDAVECPPTFSTPPGLVQAVMAGGSQALTNSVEGAEDNYEQGLRAIRSLGITAMDSVVGIAASGTTPFVLGALAAANQIGAFTVSLACNHPSPMAAEARLAIAPLVGPEVLTGSTRMKAGTAQKLVLNMLSTAIMIRLGKTYGNLMVDLNASNTKLKARARRIVAEATGLTLDQAAQILEQSDGEVKTAIIAQVCNLKPEQARQRIHAANGMLRIALQTDQLPQAEG